MKLAVVFGGAGFIGRHLIASLLARGYGEVVSADLLVPAEPVPGVRYVTCDVRQPIPADLAASAPDEVYNLAAVHQTPGHADNEYFETNVPGAQNILDYCRSQGTEKVCFTSSIAVYGPGEAPRDEESPLAPVSAYGRSKREAELLHIAWAAETETRRLVIVRPAVIFGPGEGGNFTRLAGALRRRIFFYPGRRDTIKACGYVGELVNSMRFAMERGEERFVYNFCYPRDYTIQDICEAFREVAGSPAPLGALPLGPLLAVARFFELLAMAGLKTGIHRARVLKVVQSTHIIPKTLVEAGYGYETDLAEGLRRWRAAEPAGEFV